MNIENIPWLQIILGLGAVAVAVLLINRIFPKRASTPTSTTTAGTTTTATGTTTPAPPIRTYRSPEQWVGLAIALVFCLGFIALLLIYGPPLAKRATKWADAYQPPPPPPVLTAKNLDEHLAGLSPGELEKQIQIAKKRFWEVYEIPEAEIENQLKISGGIPGSAFRLNMKLRYGLDDLPLLMSDLPDKVEKVRLGNTYTLYVTLQKGVATRQISCAGWFDTNQPTDTDLPKDYMIVCDPGLSTNPLEVVYRADKSKERYWYWTPLSNGKWQRHDPQTWHPEPLKTFTLSLLPDYPVETAEFKIFRQRVPVK